MEPVSILVLAAYASLFVELTLFPIPSEASTYQLFFESSDDHTGAERDPLARARKRAPIGKTLRYLLPTALGIGLFLIPLAALVEPDIIQHLLPIAALKSQPAILAGAQLVILGRIVTFSSVLQLRRSKRRGTLEAGGLFDHSRNPGLVGMYLFYLGNCFLFPCIVLFLGFVPYALNMHNRILMEEGHLAATLGDSYRRYLSQIPRYVRIGPRR